VSSGNGRGRSSKEAATIPVGLFAVDFPGRFACAHELNLLDSIIDREAHKDI